LAVLGIFEILFKSCMVLSKVISHLVPLVDRKKSSELGCVSLGAQHLIRIEEWFPCGPEDSNVPDYGF